MHAAGQALLLALESGRLEAKLGSTIEELRESRARIAAAGHAERRKIERNLHDGAQQHLFALGMKLELAARDAAERDPELARELSEVGDELTQVLDDLRQLARGVYPSALRDFGLERALSSAAGRSSQPTNSRRLRSAAIQRSSRRPSILLPREPSEHRTPRRCRRAGRDPVVDGQRRPLLRGGGRWRRLPGRLSARGQRLREHGRSARGLRWNLDGGSTEPTRHDGARECAAHRLAPRRLAALFSQVQKRSFHPAIDLFRVTELELEKIELTWPSTARFVTTSIYYRDVASRPSATRARISCSRSVSISSPVVSRAAGGEQLVDDLRVDDRPPRATSSSALLSSA